MQGRPVGQIWHQPADIVQREALLQRRLLGSVHDRVEAALPGAHPQADLVGAGKDRGLLTGRKGQPAPERVAARNFQKNCPPVCE